MNVWTPQGAPGGGPQIDSHPDDRPLSREDQVALELGFPPASGLSWRRRRVHQLRERVELGTYEVDSGLVAEALLARLRGAS